MKMYFVGVTTKQSSVMTLFPHWMRILGLDAVIEGVDIALGQTEGVHRSS